MTESTPLKASGRTTNRSRTSSSTRRPRLARAALDAAKPARPRSRAAAKTRPPSRTTERTVAVRGVATVVPKRRVVKKRGSVKLPVKKRALAAAPKRAKRPAKITAAQQKHTKSPYGAKAAKIRRKKLARA